VIRFALFRAHSVLNDTDWQKDTSKRRQIKGECYHLELNDAMAGLAERCKSVRQHRLRKSTAALAAALREIGIEASDASVSRYERGERTPGADYLLGLLALDPQLAPEWLATGEGPVERRPDGDTSAAQILVELDAFVDQARDRYRVTRTVASMADVELLREALARAEQILDQKGTAEPADSKQSNEKRPA
jgi:transcriptional regulator with XRE-family HTH domain